MTLNQNYARVRYVINNYQELGVGDAHTSRLRLLPSHLRFSANLINRSSQFDAICDFVTSKVVAEDLKKPLVFVLQGDKADFQRSFILRLEKGEFIEGGIQGLFAPGLPHRSLGWCPWPHGGDHLTVLRSLSAPLGLGTRGGANEVERALANIESSISFSHHVAAERWMDRDDQQLISWIDYVTESWPQPERPRCSIIFICIDVPPGVKEEYSVQKLLTAASEQNDCIYILEKFGPVDWFDVDNWLALVCRLYPDDISEEILFAACHKIQNVKDSSCKLADIYEELLSALSDAYRTPTLQFGV